MLHFERNLSMISEESRKNLFPIDRRFVLYAMFHRGAILIVVYKFWFYSRPHSSVDDSVHGNRCQHTLDLMIDMEDLHTLHPRNSICHTFEGMFPQLRLHGTFLCSKNSIRLFCLCMEHRLRPHNSIYRTYEGMFLQLQLHDTFLCSKSSIRFSCLCNLSTVFCCRIVSPPFFQHSCCSINIF